jgi:hypothetical protein
VHKTKKKQRKKKQQKQSERERVTPMGEVLNDHSSLTFFLKSLFFIHCYLLQILIIFYSILCVFYFLGRKENRGAKNRGIKNRGAKNRGTKN